MIMRTDFDKKQLLHARLESLLASLKPKQEQEQIAGVVADPNYETEFDESEESKLLEQFVSCIGKATPDVRSLKSQGFKVLVSADYSLVKKYLKGIVMYGNAGMGAWVQVLPPGAP
jgi:hypothetical protein